MISIAPTADVNISEFERDEFLRINYRLKMKGLLTFSTLKSVECAFNRKDYSNAPGYAMLGLGLASPILLSQPTFE